MSLKSVVALVSLIATMGALSACGSTSKPAAQPAPATITASAPTAPAAPSTTAPQSAPATADVQKLDPAVWATPAAVPMNETYQWSAPSELHGLWTEQVKGGGLHWTSACGDGTTVSAAGWKGTQDIWPYAPRKNFDKTPTEPGFATPWTALGDMLFFADAKSASAAYTAMSQANDACGTTETQQHKATQATARRGASIAGGQSWTVTATGADNYVWEVHYYLVQHGSYIEALRVQQSPEGFSQIPAFTGTTATDTALLTDISNRLCGYAGAC